MYLPVREPLKNYSGLSATIQYGR